MGRTTYGREHSPSRMISLSPTNSGASMVRQRRTSLRYQRCPALRVPLAVAAGTVMMLVAGAPYAVANFLPLIAADRGWSKEWYTALWLVLTAGFNSGTAIGLITDRQGPTTTLVMGALLVPGSFILMFFFSHQQNLLILCSLFFLTAVSAQCTYFPALVVFRHVSVRHWGKLFGLFQAALAGSGSVIAGLFDTQDLQYGHDSDLAQFFLTVAIALCAVDVVAVVLFRALDVTTAAAMENEEADEYLLLFSPVFSGGAAPPPRSDSQMHLDLEGSQDGVAEPVTSLATFDADVIRHQLATLQALSAPGSVTGARLFKRVEYALMMAITLLQTAPQLVMLHSVLLEKYELVSLNTTYSMLFSSGAAVAGILVGCFADQVHNLISRSSLVVITGIVEACAFLILLIYPGAFSAVCLAGISFGCSWSLLCCITAEQFGARHFGFNWGTLTTACPVGVAAMVTILGPSSSNSTVVSVQATAAVVSAILAYILSKRIRDPLSFL